MTMDAVMEVVHRHLPPNTAPKVALILGSGLSSLAEQVIQPISIPYQAIPGVRSGGGSGVAGHASVLMSGVMNGVPVVCLRGRLHLYEGVSYDAIRTLIHLVKHLGCHTLVITCAVGSMRQEAGPGELMMISDHINFHPGNPLVGPNDDSMGPRFIGMEDAYDSNLQEIMATTAQQLGIPLHRGVYISTLGPSFETPAEIRAFQRWGADAVGMSVVPEVIIARHCGLRVVCVAAVTNYAAGLSTEKITHEGTLHFGGIAAHKLTKLIPAFVRESENAMG